MAGAIPRDKTGGDDNIKPKSAPKQSTKPLQES